MTFKEKAVTSLKTMYENDFGPARAVIRECMELVEQIPDESHENIPCSAPDYEAMYRKAQEQLQELLKINDGLQCDVRMLNVHNARLAGYKEAVERIFGEGV